MSDELVLFPARGKLIAGLIGSAAFAAGGIFMVRDGAAGGWFVALFFAICAATFGAQMLPGASYLRLTRDGFIFCSVFRKSRWYRWAEVSEFRIARGLGMIVFDVPFGGELRKWSRSLVGATDGLPDSYGMKPEKQCALLNEWRARAISA
ncbi:MAG: hypothetical protein LAO79_05590 [Acidobacteriia bacterium]|nr:hypothetical protein [Terriglobia bacterium]